MAKDKKEEMFDEAEPRAAVPATVLPQGSNLPAELDDPSEYPPDDELPLPRIKILQGPSDAVTQEDRTAGVLLVNLTGEELEKITGIFLGMTRSYTRFINKELVCKAQDFTTGVGDPGGSCVACTLKDWDPDESKPMSKRKPKCQENYNFVAVDSTELKDGFPVGMPFIFSTHGAGLKYAKPFVAAGRAQRIPLFCFKAELKVRRITNDLGTFFVPIFTVLGQTPPESWGKLREVAARLIAASKRAPVEAAADGDAERSF